MHSLLQQEAERQRSGLELIGVFSFNPHEMSPPLSNSNAYVLRPTLVQPLKGFCGSLTNGR
jgi:hypothetical protein